MKLKFWKRKDSAEVKAKTTKTYYIRLVAIVVLLIGGGWLAVTGNYMPNTLITFTGVVIFGSGIWLIIGIKNINEKRIITKDGVAVTGVINTLLITLDSVEFTHVENPKGFQQQCINDSKWYHVLEKKGDAEATEFTLPEDDLDKRYYHTAEFANPVAMKANQELFEPTPNIMKAIAITAMAIIAGIGLPIAIIAMTG